MTLTMLSSPVADSYEDVKKLIFMLCHKFHAKYGVDFEELLAESNLAFMYAYHSYNPSKAKFNTWVYWNVWCALAEMIRKAAHQGNYLKRVNADLSKIAENIGRSHFDYMEFIKQVSTDAAAVVGSVLKPTLDMKLSLKNAGKKGTPKQIQYKLVDFLKELGWEQKRINDTFKEVKETIHQRETE